MIEIAVLGSGGKDEGVVGKGGAAREQHSAVGDVQVRDLAENDFGIPLTAEGGAERGGDVAWREAAGGDLIEERLKEVEVALIDDGHAGAGAAEGLGRVEPREAAADNDDAMQRAVHSRCPMPRRRSMRNSMRFSPVSIPTSLSSSMTRATLPARERIGMASERSIRGETETNSRCMAPEM